MTDSTVIRGLTPDITTFSTQFYRFAPFGFRKFVAVGNRATAIRLQDDRILLLNPVRITQSVRDKLSALGGVHYIAADLGHHLYVKDYASIWPGAKLIGVRGLVGKRSDITWDFIYDNDRKRPEVVFEFEDDIETVMFEGFMTFAVAWYHKPTKTMIVSDLLMNLPCTEQYKQSSANAGIASWIFAKAAHPYSIWHRRLICHFATTDYSLMCRDAKKVAQWDIERIIPCHGDVIVGGRKAIEAWRSLYEWFLQGRTKPGLLQSLTDSVRQVARKIFLL